MGLLLNLKGCGGWRYYQQAIDGHLAVQQARQPVAVWLDDPATDPRLAAQLRLAQTLRTFATEELQLPDNGSYRDYVDLQRPYLVKSLFAAPPLSLPPKSWCYPLIGCASYRGFFDADLAAAEAAALQAAGYEVFLANVPAYSSLGYFADPLLNTFIYWPAGALAELLFHELAHQRRYVGGDSAFNEGFATFVGEQGAQQWLAAHGDSALMAEYDQLRRYRREFHAQVTGAKADLAALYARTDLTDAEKLAQKTVRLAAFVTEYRRHRDAHWADFRGFDRWVEADLNNAKFAAFHTYRQFVPAFAALFAQQPAAHPWPEFYAAVDRLAALPRDERHAQLQALSSPPP